MVARRSDDRSIQMSTCAGNNRSPGQGRRTVARGDGLRNRWMPAANRTPPRQGRRRGCARHRGRADRLSHPLRRFPPPLRGGGRLGRPQSTGCAALHPWLRSLAPSGAMGRVRILPDDGQRAACSIDPTRHAGRHGCARSLAQGMRRPPRWRGSGAVVARSGCQSGLRCVLARLRNLGPRQRLRVRGRLGAAAGGP